LPTASERTEILKTLTKLTPLDNDVSLENIAQDSRCTDFSGADLASLVREAAVATLRATLYSGNEKHSEQNNEIHVNSSHFEIAFNKVASSVSKADKRKYDLLREKFGCATGNKVAGHAE
ncbi:14442_t:CDS:2, partial [Acaulospora morrowiae]